jgi:hypothetical protein
MNHTLQFVPIAYTNTFDVNLEWDEFSYFHALITSSTKFEFYALETYLDLTNFFYFWFLFKKKKGVPLMGLKCIALTCCKLGPRGVGPS